MPDPAVVRRALRGPRSPLTVVLAGAAVAAVIGAIVVVGPDAAAEPSGRVVTARRGVIQSTVSGSGNLQPAHQLDLRFATGGTVKRVYVKQGEHVASGQLIARIDDARQRLAVAQARAALDISKTALQDAEDTQSESDDTASAPTGATTASSGLSVVPASTRGTGTRIVPISTNPSAPATTTETAPATTTPESPTTPTGTTTTPKPSKTTPQTTTTPATTSGGHATTKTGSAAGSGSSSGSGDAATAGSGSGTANGSDGAATDGAGRSSAGGSDGSTTGKSGGSSAGGSAGGSGSTTTVASAKADVTSAELTLKDAQEALEHTRLRAPTSGTITALNGAVGDSVTAAGSSSASSSASDDSSGTGSGTAGSGGGAATGSGSGSSGGGSSSTAFASLAQLSRLDLEVSFSESDIGKLKVGQAATVTVTALDNVKLAAKVTSIGILSSTSSGVVSYPVTLAVTQKAPGIRPGMSATAEVVVAQATGISVPSQAVTGASVTVQQDGKQVRRAVTTGVVGDSATQVVSGLKVGDRVVLPALSIGSGSSSGASGAAGRAGGVARLGGGGGLGGGFGGGVPSFRRGPGGPG